MKRAAAAAFIVFLAPLPAFAVDKKIIGESMNNYATVAGGWYLNLKCHFLDEKLNKHFEDNVTLNTVGMKTVLGVDEATLLKLQDAALETSSMDKWNCENPKTREVVVSSVSMSRKLNQLMADISDMAKKAGKKP